MGQCHRNECLGWHLQCQYFSLIWRSHLPLHWLQREPNYLTLIRQSLIHFPLADWQDNHFKSPENGPASLRWHLEVPQSQLCNLHTAGWESQEEDDCFPRRHGLFWLCNSNRFRTVYPELRTLLALAGYHLAINQLYRWAELNASSGAKSVVVSNFQTECGWDSTEVTWEHSWL